MTNLQAYPRLVAALRAAAAEHGRPNTFSPGELATFYGGPPPLVTGRLLHDDHHRMQIWLALGGHHGWGSCPQYAQRRVAI